MPLSRRTIIAAMLAAPLAAPLRAQLPGNTRPASQFALDLCSRIYRAIGITPKITVRAGDVEAAQAELAGADRLIIYNESWLRQIELNTNSAIPATAVLAHEIGHHINGHTLDMIPADVRAADAGRFRLREELEADLFAGGIIARLGYPLAAGLPAFASASAVATVDHPSRTERQAYFKSGWDAAPKSMPVVARPLAPQLTTITVFSHDENDERVQAHFRGSAAGWREYQNGQAFTDFEEMYRDTCGRILLFDASRTTWVRLTPSTTGGFGLGEVSDDESASASQVPGEWRSLDIYSAYARHGRLQCSRGRLFRS